jgi:uncharacterized membrane protein
MLTLVRLEIVLIFMQGRCTVCAEHTTGSEIVLDAPDGTIRSCGWCGISLQSIWRQLLVQDRCTVCAKRTIGSEILMDAPDGTPR